MDSFLKILLENIMNTETANSLALSPYEQCTFHA